MDSTDQQIIEIVQDNGHQSNAKIARKLGMSEETVRRRLKALMNGGGLQIVGILDPERMGFECQVIVGVHTWPGKVDQVAEALADLEEIGTVMIMAGAYDIVAWLTLRSHSELHQYLSEKVNVIDGLHGVQTLVNLRTVKRTHKLKVGT